MTNVDVPEREGVKIIKSNERWVGPQVSEGIDNAKGEVISLLDNDDMFLPNKLETVYNAFKENPNLGLFKNPIKWVNENNKEWFDPMPDGPIYVSYKSLTRKQFEEIVGKYKIYFNSSSLSFRKSIIKNHIEYLKRIKLTPDVFFAFLYLAESDVVIWNKPLSIYRFLTSSTSRNFIDVENFVKNKLIISKAHYEDFNTLKSVIRNNHLIKLHLEKAINFEKLK